MNDYYEYYKNLRNFHNDHLQALGGLLSHVTIQEPDMSLREFYKMKMEFMKRYFKENYEKYNIENLD